MSQEVKKKIKAIADDLKNYNPEKVILFGSYAWGKPNRHSDFDLFIIKDTKKDFFERLREVRNCLNIDEAFDIIVYNPKEVRKRVELEDPFVTNIIKRGKIIYERRK